MVLTNVLRTVVNVGLTSRTHEAGNASAVGRALHTAASIGARRVIAAISVDLFLVFTMTTGEILGARALVGESVARTTSPVQAGLVGTGPRR